VDFIYLANRVSVTQENKREAAKPRASKQMPFIHQQEPLAKYNRWNQPLAFCRQPSPPID